MIPNALPEDDFIGTNRLFQLVAENNRRLDFMVFSNCLCRLKKRELIERRPKRSQNHEAEQRRVVPRLEP